MKTVEAIVIALVISFLCFLGWASLFSFFYHPPRQPQCGQVWFNQEGPFNLSDKMFRDFYDLKEKEEFGV